MRSPVSRLPLSLLALAACGPEATPELETSSEALDAAAVLSFLNGPDATVEVLDGPVGLDRRAAEAIAAHVRGADARLGTADDDALDSIDELDGIPHVGAAAIRRIEAYALANAPVDATLVLEGVRLSAGEAAQVLALANSAAVETLDVDAGLDGRAARAIVSARPIPTIEALAEVDYVGRAALERLLAHALRVPAPRPAPTIERLSVTTVDGTAIDVEWRAPNAESCILGLTTTVQRRRTNVVSELGLPAEGSFTASWLGTWGDRVDADLVCTGDGMNVTDSRAVTRAAPSLPPVGPVDCARLAGGSFDGVPFTAAEECAALTFLDRARFSDMAELTEIARRTAYDCTPDGRCSRTEGRRSRWRSLAEFAGFAGIGRTSVESLKRASAGFSPGPASSDTVADLWARRRSLAEVPVNLDRAYVVARRPDVPGAFPLVCVEVRDAPGAPNHLSACLRWIGADSSPLCNLQPARCLDPHVGTTVSLRGHLTRASDAPGGYRILLNADGPVPAGPAPVASPFATPSGRTVDLDGRSAESLTIDGAVGELVRALPVEFSVFVAAFRVAPSAVDDALAAAMIHELDVADWLTPGDFAVGEMPAASVGEALLGKLEGHGGFAAADRAAVAAGLAELGRRMAAGADAGFVVAQEDSGDYSYVGVATVVRSTGELRLLGFRRDP